MPPDRTRGGHECSKRCRHGRTSIRRSRRGGRTYARNTVGGHAIAGCPITVTDGQNAGVRRARMLDVGRGVAPGLVGTRLRAGRVPQRSLPIHEARVRAPSPFERDAPQLASRVGAPPYHDRTSPRLPHTSRFTSGCSRLILKRNGERNARTRRLAGSCDRQRVKQMPPPQRR